MRFTEFYHISSNSIDNQSLSKNEVFNFKITLKKFAFVVYPKELYHYQYFAPVRKYRLLHHVRKSVPTLIRSTV